jgi:hypothetical protein
VSGFKTDIFDFTDQARHRYYTRIELYVRAAQQECNRGGVHACDRV